MVLLPRHYALLLTLSRILLDTSVSGAVLPRQSSVEVFDYVIVGAGIGGSVLARRLSDDARVSVLLLEAGLSGEADETIQIPYVYERLFQSKYDYNYTLTPQPNLDGRILTYFRGKALGGSTSINGVTYTKGPASYWDKFAAYMGDDSWSWAGVQQYFAKIEAFEPPTSPPSSFPPLFNSSAHSSHGQISISLNAPASSSNSTWIVPPIMSAAHEIGIPYNTDGNSGTPLGVSWQQFTIGNGTRSSAWTGYLAGVRRDNLEVRVESTATRVRRSHGAGVRYDVVEYTDAFGETITVQATKDVILTAGVVDTPALLMRSGLGPACVLEAAGIPVEMDIPAVGQNFVEHIGLPMTWSVSSPTNTSLTEPITDDALDNDLPVYNPELAKWRESRTGRLTQTSLSHIIFGRVPENATIWQDDEISSRANNGGSWMNSDPAWRSDGPHYEQIVSNKWTSLVPSPGSGRHVGVTHFVTCPTSVGSITLNTTHPMAQPLINPNSLNTTWDRFVLRHAIRNTLRYMNASAWRAYNITPMFERLTEQSGDEEVDAFIRANAFGGAHGVSTARMGPASSPPGSDVVRPDFRVKGVEGLRIVDASAVPFMPNGHSMAVLYVVAEKAADIIRSGNAA
ncbi:hypothetical protein D9611_008086 [Ephemerocybe angulata]|uniref:pyranose dehydrogenase (acceptor) n=2 Tax=Ephemerocybe angulata TaxID=980116 RepID=A0A8H5FD65_9AGAR|nr:hypothetical protein D9611_008086 [Tulosesus angulatus]KAF6759452.1 hypothetical protein DFP72DRAFT_1043145 [Tulosesus angulatus]